MFTPRPYVALALAVTLAVELGSLHLEPAVRGGSAAERPRSCYVVSAAAPAPNLGGLRMTLAFFDPFHT